MIGENSTPLKLGGFVERFVGSENTADTEPDDFTLPDVELSVKA